MNPDDDESFDYDREIAGDDTDAIAELFSDLQYDIDDDEQERLLHPKVAYHWQEGSSIRPQTSRPQTK